MTNKERDLAFMSLALEEAEKSLADMNFPCGAVLVIDDALVSKERNQKETKSDRISHAEMNVYIQNSATIKQAKKHGSFITVYTTLEPCLMCFGTAVMHRVDRIVVASPDPLGNMSKLDGKALGKFYDGSLPKLEYGLLIRESQSLIKEYLKKVGTVDSLNYMHMFESSTAESEV